MERELVIIGGGIAGVSCALYAKRAGVTPVIFEKTAIGGQLAYINRVDNYPGIKMGMRGIELLEVLKTSLEELDIEVIGEEVRSVKKEDEKIVISTPAGEYTCSVLVIATGASFRKLEVEGEKELAGKGVSWCAICDGYFFRGKDVAVVGGGNTAVEEAVYLSSLCRKVYLIHRRDKLRAMDYLQKELYERKNIEVIWDSRVKRILGKDFVEKIELEDTKKNTVSALSVNALFIAIGIKPNTDIFKELISIDERGFIVTDEEMKTSLPFIYACGDCRRRPLRQLITAAAEGAVAALSAYKYIKGSYVSY